MSGASTESRFEVFDDAGAVAQAAADFIAATTGKVLQQKDTCHVALPGGTTPARCLELLAQKPLPWEKIHWYLGDERCLPRGDAERNDTMVRDRLWSRIDGPEANNHPIDAGLGAEAAAEAYSNLIASIGQFDLVVLGMGEDGHTASLFPGNAALRDTRPVVPVHGAPKPPPDRVSLGLETLRAARVSVVLVTGQGKREALRRIRQGEALPVATAGLRLWLVDRAASGD